MVEPVSGCHPVPSGASFCLCNVAYVTHVFQSNELSIDQLVVSVKMFDRKIPSSGLVEVQNDSVFKQNIFYYKQSSVFETRNFDVRRETLD